MRRTCEAVKQWALVDTSGCQSDKYNELEDTVGCHLQGWIQGFGVLFWVPFGGGATLLDPSMT